MEEKLCWREDEDKWTECCHWEKEEWDGGILVKEMDREHQQKVGGGRLVELTKMKRGED